jgi:hypothetical protein
LTAIRFIAAIEVLRLRQVIPAHIVAVSVMQDLGIAVDASRISQASSVNGAARPGCRSG